MRVREGFRGTLLGLFLLSTLASAAMMGPPTRRTRFLDPELATTIARPATVIALVAGVILLLLPLLSGRAAAATVETLTVTVLVLLAAISVYRAVVWTNDDHDFDAAAVVAWLVGAVGMLVLLAALAVPADRARRATEPPRPRKA